MSAHPILSRRDAARAVSGASPRVAYQGVAGAFSESAALARWGSGACTLPAATFGAALEMLCDGAAEYAVLPVWNSSIGAVSDAQRALDERADRLDVEDDLLVPVRHCLLALPGASLDTLAVVGSHPAALAQCARFLAAHPRLVPRAAFDTAGAAREVAMLGRPRAAPGASDPAPWYAGVSHEPPRAFGAIASRGAAERYGLEIVAEEIQDDPDNVTRFLVVRRRGGAGE